MVSIDDYVKEGLHLKHRDKADEIKDMVLDMRVTKLIKHYKNSLSGDKLEEFKNMSDEEQLARLREKHYILPKEHSDAFVREIAVYVAKQHDEDIAKMLEESFKTYYEDKTADYHAKAKALKRMNAFKPMLQSWGFDWVRLEEEGAKAGFSREFFEHYAGGVDEGYVGSMQDSYLDQIEEDKIHEKLDEISKEEKLKDFDINLAKGAPYKIKRRLAVDYITYKEKDHLPGFQKRHHDYFKKDSK